MRELFFDEYGMKDGTIILSFVLAFIVFLSLATYLAMMLSQWSCNTWASSNPGLEIKYFWDGFMGCMVKVDGNWINADLVREILSVR